MTSKSNNIINDALSVATAVAYTKKEVDKLNQRIDSLAEEKQKDIVEYVQGPAGEQGPRGADGATGERGERGEKGDKGDKGDRGDRGPEGLPGLAIKGDKGDKGDRGEQGPAGADGRDGIDGKDGADGKDGINGVDGKDGRDGVDGQNGKDGRDGIDGRNGIDGKDGKDGVDGKQGLKGDKGEPGERGEQGPKGDKGDDGATPDIKPLEDKFKKFQDVIEKDLQQYKNRINASVSKAMANDAWKATGSGEVNLRYLDDVNRDTITDGYVLSYNQSNNKFEFVEQNGGDGIDQWARDQANAAYDYANTLVLEGGTLDQWARDRANTAYTQANSAFAEANTAHSVGQAAYDYANSIVGFSGDYNDLSNTPDLSIYATTATTNAISNTVSTVWNTSNNAYSQANTATTNASNAYTQANLAFNTANSAWATANLAWSTANTQSDWNVTDNTSVAFIKNKPNLVTQLDDLSDVVITGPTPGQVLKFNGLDWVNDTDLTSAGSSTVPGYYGSFYDSYTQTANVANTPYPIYVRSAPIGLNGVTVSDGSKLVTTYDGVYNIQFSLQLHNTGGGGNGQNVIIWLRKNGVDVADSATDVTVNTNSPYIVAAWNFVVPSSAGDYWQIMWATDNTSITMPYVAGNSIRPAIPSVIITVSQVASILIPTDITGTANNASHLGGLDANTYASVATTNAISANVSSAWSTANSAYTQANTATSLAQAAYNYANTIVSDTQIDPWARSQANSAFNQANTATTNAANAYSAANSATSLAQSAYDAANTKSTFSGSYDDLSNKPDLTVYLTSANLTPYATTETTNTISNDVSSAWSTANSAYSAANSASSLAQSAYDAANNAGSSAQLVAAWSTANSAYTQANSATSLAQSAYDQANNGLSKDYTLNTVTSNTTIGTTDSRELFLCDTSNNVVLTVPGGNTVSDGFNFKVTRLGAGEVTLATSYSNKIRGIKFGDIDFNFNSVYDEPLSQHSSAQLDGEYQTSELRLSSFDNQTTFELVSINNTEYALVQGTVLPNGTKENVVEDYNDLINTPDLTVYATTSTTNTITTNVASAWSTANSAFAQANTATTNAATADTKADNAYNQANTATTNAASANTKAQSAWDGANLAYSTASNVYGTVGIVAIQTQDAYDTANSAWSKANTAYSTAMNVNSTVSVVAIQSQDAYDKANSAFDKANTAITTSGGTATGSITANSATAFIAGPAAVSGVALQVPTEGALRNLTNGSTNMYFDVSIGGSSHGQFQFRSSSSYTNILTMSPTAVTFNTDATFTSRTPSLARTAFNSAIDTVVTVDNIKYRVSNQGGIFPQIASASGSTVDVCYDVEGVVNGATNPTYANNSGYILLANGTWLSIYSTHGMDARGDRLTAHITDKNAGKIYRATFMRTNNSSNVDGYNIIVERII